MKKVILSALIIIIFLSGCGSSKTGELTGVPGRKKFFEPVPLEMAFIPAGSFMMGPSDQDAMFAMNSLSKSVTVEAFWMDQTEITNNKYRQFIYWVRDSILRTKLGDAGIPDREYFLVDNDGNVIEPNVINWDEKIDPEEETTKGIIEEMYYPPEERFNGKLQYDVRKYLYSYFWVDYQQASKSRYVYDIPNQTGKYAGQVTNIDGTRTDVRDRSSFIRHEIIPIYPDTLCWIRDFTYSYNEPMANMYFWHPSFDNYPVVGVTWKQASAFCIWRTQLLNNALSRDGDAYVQDYRLPLESEWEYAARGGLDNSMYPWGGLYTRNREGCYLANFKPLRGNYAVDGGVTTTSVGSYEPNEYGLYDMAGNVGEWCANAYDESAYFFQHDLNPDYKYNATEKDSHVMKRKVIRGGSWKDIAYYLQVSTRSYEYQDSSTSYIGFRCIRPYMGNK
jgi:sulfatase modifying factor 1